jgi:hypothetical protein
MADRPDEVDHRVSEDRWVGFVPAQLPDAFLEERQDDSDTARAGPAAQEIFDLLAARPPVSVHPWCLSVNRQGLPLPAAVREETPVVLESSPPEPLPASQPWDVQPLEAVQMVLPPDATERRSEMQLQALPAVREHLPEQPEL